MREQAECEKMLTSIKRNKFDTTMEKVPGAPKKTPITVWGAPKGFNYIRSG